ncbi:DUF6233 domain-containing protein [Streptomyces sp. B21-083]|uniref:DUF6233 domain-containing protein n=1 Tax=Streptomyces sp. B21-083 TaxID=3039410 RepID=UPI002FF17D54
MFDDLPPDLARLDALRVWHALWLERIDRKIAYLRQRQAEEEHGRRNRPRPPDWIVELGTSTGQPLQVHDGECGMAGTRQRAIDRDEARRLLTTGQVQACPFCHPDTQLHIIDLADPTGPPRRSLERPRRPAPTGATAMLT